ncbi:hypothetical protein [Corynebacterium striatum]|uniref:hypothetical protein n=1 Tax=Corynebacterium striatum TaxID=43770 RepID=UPI002431941B|nr:hypothetical protein [Corynebacterium striatum]MDK8833777.1 hypothetical protein [Corynebacterium striatum]
MKFTRLSAAAAIVAATLGLAACGSNESEQPTEANDQPAVDLEAAPENASWSSVGGIGTPVDSNDGPEKTSPVPHGYSHTPQGAVQAAILGQIWMATADDNTWPEVASTMTAPGPGRDQWAQGRSLISVSGSVAEEDAAEFKGFKVADYSDDKAQVLLAADYPEIGLTVYPVQLQWQDDDWKLVLPDQDNSPSMHKLESLDGFTEYAA